MDKEFLKEKLTWFRLWLTFLLAVEAACIAWFVANFTQTAKFFVYADIIVIFGLAFTIILINQKIHKNIKIMRNSCHEQ